MPFSVGHFHWGLSIAILVTWLVGYLTDRQKKNIKLTAYSIIPFLFIMGWLASFMNHVKSTPIYQSLPFLALVQFPWRFLTLATFAFSFLAGAAYLLLEKYFPKRALAYSIILVVSVIMFNWSYFLPENGKMGSLTDNEKFSGEAWQLQLTAGIYDYLPQTAKMAPKAEAKVIAEVVDPKTSDLQRDTKVKITDAEKGTDWAKFTVEGESSTIRINIFEFPTWKIKIDGKEVKHYVPENEIWGRIWIDVPDGKHQIEANFVNTPIRTISNYISLFSWLGLAVYGVVQFRLWKKN
jgi:uncharacterized membrane protein YagU involved in acid resistance